MASYFRPGTSILVYLFLQINTSFHNRFIHCATYLYIAFISELSILNQGGDPLFPQNFHRSIFKEVFTKKYLQLQNYHVKAKTFPRGEVNKFRIDHQVESSGRLILKLLTTQGL